jgi:hypothetical protein
MSDIQGAIITVLASFVFWIGALPLGRIRALLALPFCVASVVLLVWNVPVMVSRSLDLPLTLLAFASMIFALFFYYRRLRALPKA